MILIDKNNSVILKTYILAERTLVDKVLLISQDKSQREGSFKTHTKINPQVWDNNKLFVGGNPVGSIH